MKRILFTFAVCLILCAMFSGVVLASDISDAAYYGVIIATDNSTAATNVSTNISGLNTTEMIAQGWLNSSANNCAIRNSSGADVAFMPGNNSTNPWMMFVDTIGASSQKNYTLYTDDVTGGKLAIFGTFQVSDNTTLELSNNGTSAITAYLGDTSGNITDKAGAYYINYNGSNNVTAGVGILHTTNFSSYTEQDAGGFITETATNVTAVNCPSNQDCFLYKNFSSTGNFTNLTATFEINARGDAVNPFGTGGIAYTETFNDISGFAATDIWVVGNIQSGTLVNYLLGRGNMVAFDTFAGATANATYYFTLVRVGDNATCYIYSNSARTVLADTLTIAGVGATTMWRYSFGFVNNNTGVANQNFSGTISNLVTRGNPEVSCITTQGEQAVTMIPSANVSRWATGNTLRFDGTANSNINCGAIYNAATKLWISFWIDPTTTYTAGSGLEEIIGKSANVSNYYEVYFSNATGKMHFDKVTGGVTSFDLVSTQSSWPANTPIHVLVSISSVNGARFRINNGVALTSADTSAVCNGGNFVLGNLSTGAGSGFKGKIFDVVVGTGDLTTAQEDALYNGITPATATDLWYIDAGTGTTITSYGSSANTGTAGAACVWTTSTYTSGNTGRLCDFTMQVGTSRAGANLKGISVPDNANPITFGSAATPYIISANITKGGNPGGSWAWNYGATITDLTGNGNTGTPAFRTTSSNANVSAALFSFAPVSTPEAPAFAVGEGPDWLSGNVTMSGNFTTGNVTLTYPFKSLIDGLAAATSTPSQLPLTFISGFVILALSIASSALMRNFSGASAFVKAVVLFAGFGACIAVQIYDYWMIFFLAVFVITVLFAGKEGSSS